MLLLGVAVVPETLCLMKNSSVRSRIIQSISSKLEYVIEPAW